MRGFVGVTDGDWFRFLAGQPHLDEVNFWQPGGSRTFRMEPGAPFLFKLHSPENFIVGGGFFASWVRVPLTFAWETFGIANGAQSLREMHARVVKYKRGQVEPNPAIGCILLEQPFFLPRDLWVPVPADWKPNIVSGKGYDLTASPGRELWAAVQKALATTGALPVAADRAADEPRYGGPQVVLPRLGQGSFRILVAETYERRCAVTRERTLPALEAAHIQPYAAGGAHRIENGLFLRRDLHALFDQGYLTVTPDYHLEVSGRIREEFENGRDYYGMQGREIFVPGDAARRPDPSLLAWHNEEVFQG